MVHNQRSRFAWSFALWLVLVWCVALTGGNGWGAPGATVEAVAWSGTPFGVAHVQVEYHPDEFVFCGQRHCFNLQTEHGRALYPVLSRSDAGPVEADSLWSRSTSVDLYFLIPNGDTIRGTLSLSTSPYLNESSHEFMVTPQENAAARQKLLARWNHLYQQNVMQASRLTRTWPLVENYTATMLSRRLKLEPLPNQPLVHGDADLWGWITGLNEIRLATQRQRLLDSGEQFAAADQPFPVAALPPRIEIPPFDEPQIEPLAQHVPAECYYVRLRSYENFRWLRERLDILSGESLRLTERRSVDYQGRARLERQLALTENVLAEAISDLAVADLAVIGTDLLFNEGPAIGILFQARPGPLLETALRAQRQAALASSPGARDITVTIGGREASLLSTADNRVRSFYVQDGDYHLVTNSRTLARRFVEAGAGTASLAAEPDFRHARTKFAHDRPEVAFAFLSDRFFREIVGPKYRVEMTRRQQADIDLETVALAELAARNEAKPANTLESLIEAGFVTRVVTQRPDGSRVERSTTDASQWIDSLRGARRTFLPVPDVEVPAVTAGEAESYREFALKYRQIYERMDPVILSIQSDKLPEGRERITADLAVTPYTLRGIGMLRGMLAPETRATVQQIDNEVFSLDVAMNGRVLGNGSELAGIHLHGGLLDVDLPPQIRHGVQVFPQDVSFSRLFLSGSPVNSLKSVFQQLGEPDADGDRPLSLVLSNGWLRKLADDWAVVSVSKATLDQLQQQWRASEADRPAQVRLRVADLSQRKLSQHLRASEYLALRNLSEANTHLLGMFQQQLGVLPEQALAVADQVESVRHVCPLGGEYKPSREKTPMPPWISTAWPAGHTSVFQVESIPLDFESRLLKEFHGATVEVSIDAQTLRSHLELIRAPQ